MNSRTPFKNFVLTKTIDLTIKHCMECKKDRFGGQASVDRAMV